MSLITPDLIRTLQRKLYLKAKAEPEFRFHQLYDKVWRSDILAHAYRQARSNAGAPGVDGVTFAMIEEMGSAEWLLRLREELHFLVCRHKVAGRGTRKFPLGTIRGELGVLALRPALATRRGPGGEASRRASCGKSARCVR